MTNEQPQAISAAKDCVVIVIDFEAIPDTNISRPTRIEYASPSLGTFYEHRAYVHPVTHEAWAARNRTWLEDADWNEITEGGE